MDNQEQYTNPYFNQTIELKTNDNEPSSDSISNKFNSIIVGSGKKVFRVDERGQFMGSDKYETARFKVDMMGRLFATSAVITGTTSTSTGTTRVEMNGPANEFRVYNNGTLVASLGAFDGNEGEMFNITYNTNISNAPVRIQGYVPNSSMVYIKNDETTASAVALTISSPTTSASGALYVRSGYSNSLTGGKAAVFQNSGNGSDAAVEIYGGSGGVYNGTALKLFGAFKHKLISPDTDNTYYLGNSSYKYAGIYVTSGTSTSYAGSVGGGSTTSGDSAELTSGPGNLFAGHTHTIPAHTHGVPMHSHTINFNTVSIVINGTTYNLLRA